MRSNYAARRLAEITAEQPAPKQTTEVATEQTPEAPATPEQSEASKEATPVECATEHPVEPVPAEVTQRTKASILSEIKAIRNAFTNGSPYSSRHALLEETLEALRANAVAERIVALEAELAQVTE